MSGGKGFKVSLVTTDIIVRQQKIMIQLGIDNNNYMFNHNKIYNTSRNWPQLTIYVRYMH